MPGNTPNSPNTPPAMNNAFWLLLICLESCSEKSSSVATDDDFSEQLSKQMSSNQNALFIAGGVLGLLGVLPGMPHGTFITFAFLFAGLAYMIKRKAAALRLIM